MGADVQNAGESDRVAATLKGGRLEDVGFSDRVAQDDPVAVEVEALGRFGPAAAAEAQALLPTALPGLGPVVADRVEQALQLFGGQFLGRVGLELAGPALRPIGPERPLPGRAVAQRPPATRSTAPVT